MQSAVADKPLPMVEYDPAPQSMRIIERAVENKIPAAELRELVTLQREIHRDRAVAAYFADMAECQREMPQLPKSKQGRNNRYSPYDEVDKFIRPIYTKWGFSLEFSEVLEKSTATDIAMICTVQHRLGHSRPIYGVYPRDGFGPKGEPIAMNPIQRVGSTHSYAKRYLVKDVFALAEADEDTDAQAVWTSISEDQAAEIQKMIEAKGVEITRFLNWASETAKFEVRSLKELPTSLYAIALDMLKKKKAGGQ